MTGLRYRIQPRRGPDPLDRSYGSLRAAKGQLTQLARRYRIFSYVIVDQETGARFAYDTDLHGVVPLDEGTP